MKSGKAGTTARWLRRTTALFLAICLSVSLAACGADPEEKKEKEGTGAKELLGNMISETEDSVADEQAVPEAEEPVAQEEDALEEAAEEDADENGIPDNLFDLVTEDMKVSVRQTLAQPSDTDEGGALPGDLPYKKYLMELMNGEHVIETRMDLGTFTYDEAMAMYGPCFAILDVDQDGIDEMVITVDPMCDGGVMFYLEDGQVKSIDEFGFGTYNRQGLVNAYRYSGGSVTLGHSEEGWIIVKDEEESDVFEDFGPDNSFSPLFYPLTQENVDEVIPGEIESADSDIALNAKPSAEADAVDEKGNFKPSTRIMNARWGDMLVQIDDVVICLDGTESFGELLYKFKHGKDSDRYSIETNTRDLWSLSLPVEQFSTREIRMCKDGETMCILYLQAIPFSEIEAETGTVQVKDLSLRGIYCREKAENVWYPYGIPQHVEDVTYLTAFDKLHLSDPYIKQGEEFFEGQFTIHEICGHEVPDYYVMSGGEGEESQRKIERRPFPRRLRNLRVFANYAHVGPQIEGVRDDCYSENDGYICTNELQGNWGIKSDEIIEDAAVIPEEYLPGTKPDELVLSEDFQVQIDMPEEFGGHSLNDIVQAVIKYYEEHLTAKVPPDGYFCKVTRNEGAGTITVHLSGRGEYRGSYADCEINPETMIGFDSLRYMWDIDLNEYLPK